MAKAGQLQGQRVAPNKGVHRSRDPVSGYGWRHRRGPVTLGVRRATARGEASDEDKTLTMVCDATERALADARSLKGFRSVRGYLQWRRQSTNNRRTSRWTRVADRVGMKWRAYWRRPGQIGRSSTETGVHNGTV